MIYSKKKSSVPLCDVTKGTEASLIPLRFEIKPSVGPSSAFALRKNMDVASKQHVLAEFPEPVFTDLG